MTTQTIIIAVYLLIFLFISLLVFNHFSNETKKSKANKKRSIAEEFKGKKVLIDGEFKKEHQQEIKDQLKEWNVEVEPKMSTKTGILITGKNADELVIEEAKDFGAKIYSEESFLALNKAPHYVFTKNRTSIKSKATVKIQN